MRDKRLDVLKGLGIILMVYRHAYAPFSSIFQLFHMSVFFIASGLLFKPEGVRDAAGFGGYIKRKILHLWLPSFIFTSLFVILNNFFIHINIYTTNPAFLENAPGHYVRLAEVFGIKDILMGVIKAVFMRTATEIGGALWFFQTLLYVTVAYGLIEFLLVCTAKKFKFIKPLIVQGVVAVIFLLLGWFCSINKITTLSLDRLFSCYILFYIGQIIRNCRSYYEKYLHGVLPVVIFALSIVIAVVLRKIGFVAIDRNHYPNPAFFVFAALLGWIIYYLAATFIVTKTPFASGFLEEISKKSVFIVGLHFLAFKLVNWLYVMVTHQEAYMVASFPIATYSGAWWLLYVLVGVLLPLGVAFAYEFLKMKIKK